MNRKIDRTEPLSGGRNSQVLLLVSADGNRYVAKRFFDSMGDPRNRFQTEHTAVSFMRKNGITCIPRPLSVDIDEKVIIYEYIVGGPVGRIGVGDIERICDFMIHLDQLKKRDEAAALPLASEAFFTVSDLIRNVRQRLHRLKVISDAGLEGSEMKGFLDRSVEPFLNHVTGWIEDRLSERSLDPDQVLPEDARTLSPSDLGFHNALRTACGGLIFHDFEYFGWDDPAKLIIDFALHPGMTLTQPLRGCFVEKMMTYFDSSGRLGDRIRDLYPLLGIKWSLILLNEFIPFEDARRRFAWTDRSIPRETILGEQLRKASKMLDTIIETYDKRLPFKG